MCKLFWRKLVIILQNWKIIIMPSKEFPIQDRSESVSSMSSGSFEGINSNRSVSSSVSNIEEEEEESPNGAVAFEYKRIVFPKEPSLDELLVNFKAAVTMPGVWNAKVGFWVALSEASSCV